jgi:hypothetical protein
LSRRASERAVSSTDTSMTSCFFSNERTAARASKCPPQ